MAFGAPESRATATCGTYTFSKPPFDSISMTGGRRPSAAVGQPSSQTTPAPGTPPAPGHIYPGQLPGGAPPPGLSWSVPQVGVHADLVISGTAIAAAAGDYSAIFAVSSDIPNNDP